VLSHDGACRWHALYHKGFQGFAGIQYKGVFGEQTPRFSLQNSKILFLEKCFSSPEEGKREMKRKESNMPKSEGENRENPDYTPPTIKTYTSKEILEEIGPAQACSPSPCGGGVLNPDGSCGISPSKDKKV